MLARPWPHRGHVPGAHEDLVAVGSLLSPGGRSSAGSLSRARRAGDGTGGNLQSLAPHLARADEYIRDFPAAPGK
jgi:hypothetical protein